MRLSYGKQTKFDDNPPLLSHGTVTSCQSIYHAACALLHVEALHFPVSDPLRNATRFCWSVILCYVCMKKRQQFAANSINLLIRHIVLQANNNTANIKNLLNDTNARKIGSDT